MLLIELAVTRGQRKQRGRFRISSEIQAKKQKENEDTPSLTSPLHNRRLLLQQFKRLGPENFL